MQLMGKVSPIFKRDDRELNISRGVKAHFVTTAHYVTTRAFRIKISAHFVTTRIL